MLEGLRYFGERIFRRIGTGKHDRVDIFEHHRLLGRRMEEIGARRIGAIEPHHRQYLDAKAMQPCQMGIASIVLDCDAGREPVDRVARGAAHLEEHRLALAGERGAVGLDRRLLLRGDPRVEIGLGLHGYHDLNGSLPPALAEAQLRADGTYTKVDYPYISWMTRLLPFVEAVVNPRGAALRIGALWIDVVRVVGAPRAGVPQRRKRRGHGRARCAAAEPVKRVGGVAHFQQ